MIPLAAAVVVVSYGFALILLFMEASEAQIGLALSWAILNAVGFAGVVLYEIYRLLGRLSQRGAL